MKKFAYLLMLLPMIGACLSDSGPPGELDVPDVDVAPPPPALQRLSQSQYENSIHDLIGEEIVIPPQLEPDVTSHGLISIGMSQATISPVGAEKYEDAAYKIAAQTMDNDGYRKKIAVCAGTTTGDVDCLKQIVEALGYRAWRRPLEAEEVSQIAEVAAAAGTTTTDFDTAVEFAIAAILQSPNFLFRVEIGEPDPNQAGRYRYSDYEMASRLSYFLTNSTPDDALLAAAKAGKLTTQDGLRAEAERLLNSEKARGAVRNFFTELYELHELRHLSKDPTIFTHMSNELGPAAMEETLLVLERIVFEEDSDFREFFTSRETYVDRRLAALYGVAAPVTEGFGLVTMPEESGRRGFLGQVSFLANQSHPGASSAVLRGRFIRVNVLCGEVPPPPANFNTGVPEPSEDAKTLRERSEIHYSNEVCASCHKLMDPVGLGLENFDAIGQWRVLDNGGAIDPSGEIEYSAEKSVSFADAWALAEAVAEHPKVGFCLARSAYRYATGGVETKGEFAQLDALAEVFEQSGYRVQELLIQTALSPGFRTVAEVEEEAEESEEEL